ncbi:MAG: PAS domain S-box protein [Bacillati bacterium ANGP1]|uniref:PAS domain S-box protein n=1 Tax=Candidatus Segetimicrobium genomatis TaxID=2569760 RepID=A0A537KY23_9BACT|nr:MAG: PAS domain S-box protein [Terrabacteria group bacterium ANGP1]
MKARTRTSIRNVRSLAPEHDYSGVLSGLPVGLYQSTPAGRILDANPAMVRMLGYPTRDALLAINAGDLYVNPEDRQRWQALIERERVLVDFETQYRRHDGTVIWVQDRARALIADDGEAVYYAGILVDITARKQAEEVLRQNEASFRLLFAGNPLPMWVYDLSTLQFLEVNAAAITHYGYTREEFLGMRITDIRPPEDVGRLMADLAKRRPALQSSGEWRHRRKDGRVIDVQIESHAIAFSGHDAVLVVAQDITDRKRAEEALAESEEQYRYLFENANDAIFTIDLRGNFTSVNKAAEMLSGYPRAEALQQNIADVLPPEHLATARAMLATKLGGGDPTRYEVELLTKDGRRVPVEIGTTLVSRFGEPMGVQGVGRDMTERKRAEEEIKRHLNRLTALRAIDVAIASSLDLSLALNVLLDQVTTQLQVHAAAVLLLNPHTQVLEAAATRGFRSNEIQRTRLRLGEGLAGRAALERRMVSSENLAEAGRSFTRAELLAKERFVAYYAAPLVAKGQIEGVLEVFHRGPFEPTTDWLDFFTALAGQAAIAVDNVHLFSNLQTANLELKAAYDNTLEGWVRALDLRDKETEGHTQRVTDLTVRLAKSLGVPEADLVHVYRGALLHDIGKMAIPDAVLLKPGPLTPDERQIIERHPVYAYEFLSAIPYLRQALDIPYCHHEKWDGTGYPRGLKGEQIPLVARIFAVVDVWDALRSDRPYRKGWTDEKALQYIREQAGSHFDRKIVESFFKVGF